MRPGGGTAGALPLLLVSATLVGSAVVAYVSKCRLRLFGRDGLSHAAAGGGEAAPNRCAFSDRGPLAAPAG
eukprot:5292090-Pyramimonas_sp.AAC.1